MRLRVTVPVSPATLNTCSLATDVAGAAKNKSKSLGLICVGVGYFQITPNGTHFKKNNTWLSNKTKLIILNY